MLSKLKEKLYFNPSCNLTISELRLLYELDFVVDDDLSDYRDRRNNYEDFSKLFGNKSIACTEEEITEDTICYIGDLIIDKKLLTYNIRYIYGYITYKLSKIYNLENLEIIYKDAYFKFSDLYENLSNLRSVYGILYLYCIPFNYNLCLDLSSIENVYDLNIEVEHYKYDEIILPSNLKKLFLQGYLGTKIFDTLNLPTSLEELKILKPYSIKKLKLPKNLKKLYLSTIDQIKGMDIHKNLEIYETLIIGYKRVSKEKLVQIANIVSDEEYTKAYKCLKII